MSSVCAITQMTMIDAMEFRETREIIEKVLIEGIKVAEADGYYYGDRFFSECIKYLSMGGNHKPSMCSDLENRCRTEIDYLNMKIVEYGKQHNVATQYNQVLTSLIKAIEFQIC